MVATTFWGARMRVVLPELVSCEIHEHGVIEAPLTAQFIELVGPGAVVYDVGAHLGYYSALAAALGGTVHAFEPSSGTLPDLRANVPGRVTIVPAALWDHETTFELKDFGAAHSAVNTLLSPKDEDLSDPVDAYAVDATTVDSYVERTRDVPTFIKIDAEGAELQVLRGAETTLVTARPYVSVEVGDTREQRTSRPALEFALKMDYAAYDLTDRGPTPHTLREGYPYGNVLLIPRETKPPLPAALDAGA